MNALFSDSDVTTVTTAGAGATSAPSDDAEHAALRHLSRQLAALRRSPDLAFCADARIVVPSAASPTGSHEEPVHKCVLSARSPFFRERFAGGGAARVELADVAAGYGVGREALAAVLEYVYTGGVAELPRGFAECADEECGRHEACWPAVDFMLQVLYAAAVFQISELVNLFQRRLLDILHMVEVENILAVLKVANLCNKACVKLLDKCIAIVVESDIDYVTLEKKLAQDVIDQIEDYCLTHSIHGPAISTNPDKRVKSIYKALDADDVELVDMLLQEGWTTLDDANALHYAVAHCDARVTEKLLGLNLADLDHTDSRGYTVLHIAAMRKNADIMMALLKMGAEPSFPTRDGKKAIQIVKRLTCYADYRTEEGNASSEGKMCIEMLERAEIRDSRTEATSTPANSYENLHENLAYLEERVALARSLFPNEAQVAMNNAQVEGTIKFVASSVSRSYSGSKRPLDDSSATSSEMTAANLIRRKDALSKTVELGRRFFPRCSKVIDKFVDDDLTELAMLEQTTNNDELKKKRFHELQAEVMEAYNQDKRALGGASAFASPSKAERIRRKKHPRT